MSLDVYKDSPIDTRQPDRHTDRQADRQTDTYKHLERKEILMDRLINGKTEADRQTDRQRIRNGHKDIQTNTQAD